MGGAGVERTRGSLAAAALIGVLLAPCVLGYFAPAPELPPPPEPEPVAVTVAPPPPTVVFAEPTFSDEVVVVRVTLPQADGSLGPTLMRRRGVKPWYEPPPPEQHAKRDGRDVVRMLLDRADPRPDRYAEKLAVLHSALAGRAMRLQALWDDIAHLRQGAGAPPLADLCAPDAHPGTHPPARLLDAQFLE